MQPSVSSFKPTASTSFADVSSIAREMEASITSFKGKGKPPGPVKKVIKGAAAAGVGALVVRSITSPPGAPGGKTPGQGGKKVVTKTQVTRPTTTTTGPAKGGVPPPHRNQPPPRRKIALPPVPGPPGPHVKLGTHQPAASHNTRKKNGPQQQGQKNKQQANQPGSGVQPHTSNIRPSTKDKHQKGQARKQRDQQNAVQRRGHPPGPGKR
jgi:hypothetical protein